MRRSATSFGELAEWDTSEYTPSAYELRLTAVDRNNVILSGPATCTIELELLP